MGFLSLRSETEDDLPFLVALYASTRAAEMAMVPWSAAEKEEFVRSQFGFQRKHYLENYRDASFQVILVDAQPAGRLYINRAPQEIRIVDIALLPEFRARGIGSALLRDIQAEGQISGRPVTIHVERNNPALRLYQRLGFRLLEDQGSVYLLMEYRYQGTRG